MVLVHICDVFLGVSPITVLSLRWASEESAQYGDAQHCYTRAFDTEYGELGVALCDAIQIEWVRFRRGDIGWRCTVKDIICWVGFIIEPGKLKTKKGERYCTGGDKDECESELLGKGSEMRGYIDVQLAKKKRASRDGCSVR